MSTFLPAFLASIPPLQKLAFSLAAIIVLMLLYALFRIINSADNPLKVWELLATRGQDGLPHPDWDKIGKGVGVMLCVWLPGVYAYSDKMEAGGLAAVMGVALTYLGAVSSYSATLRAKQGSVVTETKTELLPAKVTETKTEMPPIKN